MKVSACVIIACLENASRENSNVLVSNSYFTKAQVICTLYEFCFCRLAFFIWDVKQLMRSGAAMHYIYVLVNVENI